MHQYFCKIWRLLKKYTFGNFVHSECANALSALSARLVVAIRVNKNNHRHFQLIRVLLLPWRYNSDRVLAFSTIPFHLRRSWTCSVHFIRFTFFKSFFTSSSQRDLCFPAGLHLNGFHLYILLTMLVSGILFMCPNQLSL